MGQISLEYGRISWKAVVRSIGSLSWPLSSTTRAFKLLLGHTDRVWQVISPESVIIALCHIKSNIAMYSTRCRMSYYSTYNFLLIFSYNPLFPLYPLLSSIFFYPHSLSSYCLHFSCEEDSLIAVTLPNISQLSTPYHVSCYSTYHSPTIPILFPYYSPIHSR